MMTTTELTTYIKAEAQRLGFDLCGVARAAAVSPQTALMQNNWIDAGMHATMHYLERNCDKRLNPTLLVEGCKSIVSVALNYAPKEQAKGIAAYAQGKDYHTCCSRK